MEILNAYSDDDALYLVTRGDDGRRKIDTISPEYSCFVRAADATSLREGGKTLLDQLRAVRQVKRVIEDRGYYRVVWRDKWSRLKACRPKGWFDQEGVEVLEADVDPVRRFLTDRPEVQIAKPRRCYVDFEADSRKTADSRDDARMLAWSIVDEEDPGPEDRCIDFDVAILAAADDPGPWTLDGAVERIRGLSKPRPVLRTDRKTVRVVASGVLVEDSDEAERILVEEFWRAIEPYDQVVAWAGDFFDFPYLSARTSRLRLRVDERRWLWVDQLPWYRVRATDADGEEKQSLKLDDVARLKTGVGKLEGVSGADSWKLWLSDPLKLLAYCERDSALCVLIERATGHLGILTDLAQLSKCFPDSNGRRARVGRSFFGVQPTSQVEGFLMQLGAARGHRFRSHWYDPDLEEKRADYAGGHVEDPAVGMHDEVHVCDFARLYPNAIMSFNLSPETYRGKVPERPTYALAEPTPIPEGCAVVPGTRALFAQEPRGVLPLALERLLEMRRECSAVKKKYPPNSPEWIAADQRDQSLKTAINAYYGVVGSVYSRFFLREVAESTTLIGQWLIKATMREAREHGSVIRGGDTDSTFANGRTEEEFRAFVEWCNTDLYPRMLRECGATRCTISLEFEKTFRRMLIAGKKRYAGLVTSYKGVRGTKLVIRGLEARRGDWPRMAARLQEEVLRLAVGDGVTDSDVFADLVQRMRDVVLPRTELVAGNGRSVPKDCSEPLAVEEVSRWQRLAKELDEYVVRQKIAVVGEEGEDAAQGAHVTVARVLKARGVQIGKGSKIAYVVVDGSKSPAKAIPAEDYTGELDRYYLWEQLVYPPTMRVLQAAFPEEDWARFERARPSKKQAGDPRQLKLF